MVICNDRHIENNRKHKKVILPASHQLGVNVMQAASIVG